MEEEKMTKKKERTISFSSSSKWNMQGERD